MQSCSNHPFNPARLRDQGGTLDPVSQREHSLPASFEDACQSIEELGHEAVVEAGDISDGCVLARVMWNLQSPLDAFPLSEAATAGTRGYTQPTPLRQRAGLDEAHPGLPAYRGSLRPSHREVG
jgi:hypothetical protein